MVRDGADATGTIPFSLDGSGKVNLFKGGQKMCSPQKLKATIPETNSEFAPENGWREDEIPFGMAYLQVLCCGFVDGKAE